VLAPIIHNSRFSINQKLTLATFSIRENLGNPWRLFFLLFGEHHRGWKSQNATVSTDSDDPLAGF